MVLKLTLTKNILYASSINKEQNNSKISSLRSYLLSQKAKENYKKRQIDNNVYQLNKYTFGSEANDKMQLLINREKNRQTETIRSKMKEEGRQATQEEQEIMHTESEDRIELKFYYFIYLFKFIVEKYKSNDIFNKDTVLTKYSKEMVYNRLCDGFALKTSMQNVEKFFKYCDQIANFLNNQDIDGLFNYLKSILHDQDLNNNLCSIVLENLVIPQFTQITNVIFDKKFINDTGVKEIQQEIETLNKKYISSEESKKTIKEQIQDMTKNVVGQVLHVTNLEFLDIHHTYSLQIKLIQTYEKYIIMNPNATKEQFIQHCKECDWFTQQEHRKCDYTLEEKTYENYVVINIDEMYKNIDEFKLLIDVKSADILEEIKELQTELYDNNKNIMKSFYQTELRELFAQPLTNSVYDILQTLINEKKKDNISIEKKIITFDNFVKYIAENRGDYEQSIYKDQDNQKHIHEIIKILTNETLNSNIKDNLTQYFNDKLLSENSLYFNDIQYLHGHTLVHIWKLIMIPLISKLACSSQVAFNEFQKNIVENLSKKFLENVQKQGTTKDKAFDLYENSTNNKFFHNSMMNLQYSLFYNSGEEGQFFETPTNSFRKRYMLKALETYIQDNDLNIDTINVSDFVQCYINYIEKNKDNIAKLQKSDTDDLVYAKYYDVNNECKTYQFQSLIDIAEELLYSLRQRMEQKQIKIQQPIKTKLLTKLETKLKEKHKDALSSLKLNSQQYAKKLKDNNNKLAEDNVTPNINNDQSQQDDDSQHMKKKLADKTWVQRNPKTAAALASLVVGGVGTVLFKQKSKKEETNNVETNKKSTKKKKKHKDVSDLLTELK